MAKKIITYTLIGQDCEWGNGYWTATSDIRLDAPPSLCDMDFYIEGEGRTAKEAMDALIANLRQRGYSGTLRRHRP